MQSPFRTTTPESCPRGRFRAVRILTVTSVSGEQDMFNLINSASDYGQINSLEWSQISD
jgi:hypothetical protein